MKYYNKKYYKKTFNIYDSLSSEDLEYILDDSITFISNTINNYAYVFKKYFKGYDYDDFYYSCLSLREQLCDIKIIINILKNRNND